MKKIIFLIIVIIMFVFVARTVRADCDPNNKSCIQDEIHQYQQKINELQGQANTLSNQITAFDAQIRLAELKVQQTEDEIKLLGGRIDQVELSLQALTKAFSARAVATYKMSRTEEPTLLLLSSQDLLGAVSKFHYLQKVEDYDQSLMMKLQSARSEEHTSELQSPDHLVCRLLLEKKKHKKNQHVFRRHRRTHTTITT